MDSRSRCSPPTFWHKKRPNLARNENRDHDNRDRPLLQRSPKIRRSAFFLPNFSKNRSHSLRRPSLTLVCTDFLSLVVVMLFVFWALHISIFQTAGGPFVFVSGTKRHPIFPCVTPRPNASEGEPCTWYQVPHLVYLTEHNLGNISHIRQIQISNSCSCESAEIHD